MINGMRRYSVLILFAATALAQTTTFQGRPAVALSNDKLDVLLLKQGASVASVVLRDDPAKLNPLWVSAGSGTGQFLCVDGFGPVSPEEKAAGLPGHGEAHTVEWESRMDNGRLVMTSRLPITRETITRIITLQPGENVVMYDTSIESELGFDRPICWAEHCTIGAPFLAAGVTVADFPAVRSKTRPYDRKGGPPYRLPSDVEFTWPNAPGVDGKMIDLRPAPVHTNSIDHTASLIDPKRPIAFATAINPEKHLIVGWIFKPAEYPWLQNWENYPPDGKLARGLELSTQPFDLPRRTVIEQNNLWGTLLYRWLPAKSKIGSRFAMFYAHAPEGMTRVDDLRWENGVLVLEDRASGHVLRLKMAQRL